MKPLHPLQKVFHQYGVGTNENTDMFNAVHEMCNNVTERILQNNPDAITFCCRCGCAVRLDEVDEFGICCL